MDGLPGILLAIASLLVVVSAVQPIARKLALPETVLLAVIGIVIGGGADFLLETPRTHAFDRAARVLVDFPIDSETVLLIFLPILVFAGALSIDARRLARDATSVLVLAIVAVVVSTALIGYAIYPFAGVSLPVCLMMGAIVANTDPSAVTAIFRDIGAASRLTRLVEGEALLNDAAAISIFSILLHGITGHETATLGHAVYAFAVSFAGALVVGVLLGRATLMLIATIGETTAGEVTLTLALPFIAYVVSEHLLHLSGVVAVAASGLTLSIYGPSTMQPQSWRFLSEMWEQLSFWAGSLVFVLASMLVPRLLLGATFHDLGLVLLAVAAALVARAAVLFLLLPALARLRLSRAVPNPFKITILWGGLRGAITLALALAVTENPDVSAANAHLVATCATGFVLFTLLVNGTTLRSLVVFQKLDQLSPRDEALRNQVVAIGLTEVRERTRRVAGELGFSPSATRHVIDSIEERAAREQQANDFDAAISDTDRVSLALVTIASRERTLLIELFRFRGLTPGVVESLLRNADSMVDGARYDGRLGYLRAARRRLRPNLRFRAARTLHVLFRYDTPLMHEMARRYEILLVTYLLAVSLTRFMRRRIEPMLGTRVAEIVSEILERRRRLLGDALGAMRLHHQGYAEALEGRVLRLTGLRFEAEEYDGLLEESLIGEELHSELVRDVDLRRRRLERRLRFDIRASIDARIRALPLFADVDPLVLHDVAMLLSIRFTTPGEELIARGARPKTAYLVSSGSLELHSGDRNVTIGEGGEAGASEILARSPMPGTVRSMTFCHLLEIRARDLLRIIAENPTILRNLEHLANARAALLRGEDAVPAMHPAHPAVPAERRLTAEPIEGG